MTQYCDHCVLSPSSPHSPESVCAGAVVKAESAAQNAQAYQNGAEKYRNEILALKREIEDMVMRAERAAHTAEVKEKLAAACLREVVQVEDRIQELLRRAEDK